MWGGGARPRGRWTHAPNSEEPQPDVTRRACMAQEHQSQRPRQCCPQPECPEAQGPGHIHRYRLSYTAPAPHLLPAPLGLSARAQVGGTGGPEGLKGRGVRVGTVPLLHLPDAIPHPPPWANRKELQLHLTPSQEPRLPRPRPGCVPHHPPS